MSEVTCPRCTTRQPIGAHAEGYACVECGTEWVFATCDSCGDRFHMHPGTQAWTCPTCGTAHGSVPAVPTRAASAAETAGRATVASPPDPATTGRRSQPPMGPILAVAGILLVVAVAFLLTRGGGGGNSGTPSASGDPVTALCVDLRDLQTPRVDALSRVLRSLPAHADAIAAAGNETLAANVRALTLAVKAYRDALETQADDTAALQQMGAALAKLPC